MWKWLRWFFLALLIYYIIVFPQDAAQLTRSIVTGAIELFTGAARSVAAFLRAIV